MIWKYIGTWLLGLLFLYLQLLVMPVFELAGCIPNILIPWLIYLIWSRPRDLALIISFIITAMYDVSQPAMFGFTPFAFLLIGIALSEARKPFEAQSKVARMLTLLLANLIYSLMLWLTLGVGSGFSAQLAILSLISFAYNLAISFVVFWILYIVSRMRVVIVND